MPFDFDCPVGDFRDFGFEKAADKIRVAAGEDDFRAACAVFHSDDISAYSIAYGVFFSGDALAIRHNTFEFAEVDDHVRTFETAHGAGDDFTGAILELVVDHLLLRLADPLHDGLASRLCGNTLPKSFGVTWTSSSSPSSAYSLIRFLASVKADFVVFVDDFFDHRSFADSLDVAWFRVDFDAQFAGWADRLTGS